MPISITNLGQNSASAAASITLTNLTVPAGALIVVSVVDFAGALGSGVTDGASNTYNRPTSISDGAGGIAAIYFAYKCNALSNQTITYTKGDSVNGALMTCCYATGIYRGSNPNDTAVNATNSAAQTATPSVTAGTPTQSGELVIGCLAWNNAGNGTFTQESGWSTPSTQCDAFNISLATGSIINPSDLSWGPTVASMGAPYMMELLGFRNDSPKGGNMPMLGW